MSVSLASSNICRNRRIFNVIGVLHVINPSILPWRFEGPSIVSDIWFKNFPYEKYICPLTRGFVMGSWYCWCDSTPELGYKNYVCSPSIEAWWARMLPTIPWAPKFIYGNGITCVPQIPELGYKNNYVWSPLWEYDYKNHLLSPTSKFDYRFLLYCNDCQTNLRVLSHNIVARSN